MQPMNCQVFAEVVVVQPDDSSASAGGMLPMGSKSRRLLNQSTHSRASRTRRLLMTAMARADG